MGREYRTKGGVLTISQFKIKTRLFYKVSDSRINHVTYAREKGMFDLKIQTTQEPTLHSAASSEIHSRFDLMERPGIFHRAGVLLRQRELGLFNAMSKLKHDADNHASKTDYQNVEQEHYPKGMEKKRQSKSQRHEQHFTADKPDEFPPFRPG